MLNICKIRLEELSEFIKSDEFKRLDTIPISSIRALSYSNNPNGLASDYVLYLGYLDAQLVAFRSIWRDVIHSNRGQHSFGWLSGNWVHPAHRRQGFSSLLFEEVYKDWEGLLMTVNNSPASRAGYLRSEKMSIFLEQKGVRFYQQFPLSEVLPDRYPFLKSAKSLLHVIDKLGNALFGLMLPRINASDLNWQITNHADSSTFAAAFSKIRKEGPFRQTADLYQWIQDYPWINDASRSKLEQSLYPFSVWSSNFRSQVYQLSTADSHNEGWLQFNHRGDSLTVPYCFHGGQESLLQAIFYLLISQGAKYTTIFDKELISYFQQQRRSFVYTKSIFQTFLISNGLKSLIGEVDKSAIQYGDGDAVFV